jgi:hypothetical protein
MWRPPARADSGGVTDHRSHRLFLVELRSTRPDGDEAQRMSQALRLAVGRFRTPRLGLGWLGAVTVEDPRRALCLVSATDESQVLTACDTAGLAQAHVREATPLPASTWPATFR